MLDLEKSRDTVIVNLAAGVSVLDTQGPRRRTRSELRKECAKRGIPFDPKATHDELAAALRHHVDNAAWSRAASEHEAWRKQQQAAHLRAPRPIAALGIRY